MSFNVIVNVVGIDNIVDEGGNSHLTLSEFLNKNVMLKAPTNYIAVQSCSIYGCDSANAQSVTKWHIQLNLHRKKAKTKKNHSNWKYQCIFFHSMVLVTSDVDCFFSKNRSDSNFTWNKLYSLSNWLSHIICNIFLLYRKRVCKISNDLTIFGQKLNTFTHKNPSASQSFDKNLVFLVSTTSLNI